MSHKKCPRCECFVMQENNPISIELKDKKVEICTVCEQEERYLKTKPQKPNRYVVERSNNFKLKYGG